MKLQKQELEAILENPNTHKDKQMRVCEICGAMQSLTDTDKRLTTHLEGKLHQGFAKVRKLHQELLQKKEEYRHMKEREGREGRKGRRSRSKSGSPRALKKKAEAEHDAAREDRFNYSSTKYGAGTNLPDGAITLVRHADAALELNTKQIGVPVGPGSFNQQQLFVK